MANQFKRIFEVDPSHLGQAQDIADTIQQAIDPASPDFDFARIRQAAGALPDASLVKFVPGFGLQETTPVSVLAHSLTESLRQALSRPFANEAFWRKAEEALTDAFVNLGAQEGSSHLAFHAESADSTSYFYDLLFALQDDETEDSVWAVVFCLDVTLALDGAATRSLTPEDRATYAIRLNAITVRQDLRSVAA
ncbi:Type-2Aa cytolytic delta-endotoxin [Streptomyces sp. NPDC000410]|uniref:Type-2Aa cytolytic delta-endotoxin n=1 Tax=Streptomyces sp. NPDC000410 TaxID=3154254 RepID=UPI003327F6EE